MNSVTLSNIKKFAPSARDDLVNAIVASWPAAEAAGIDTPLRTQHFFAQIATETGGFKAIAENLNYSVGGLRKIFSKARISDAQCKKLGRSPGRPADQQGIANRVYGGAWGKTNLGNTQADDGWRYRGSGFIQTTGRSNFRACGQENDPDSLRTPDLGFAAALVFWTDHDINAPADEDDVTKVRRKINPGLAGLDHAKEFLKKARKVFV
jgi:putative chitinase